MSANDNARPAANGTGGEQVGQTSSQSTHMPDMWHEQCEWENAASYAQGFADGYAAAELAIADEITRAIGVKPYSRKAVLKWLINTMDDAAAAKGRRPEPYSSPENGTTLGVADRDVLGRWAA